MGPSWGQMNLRTEQSSFEKELVQPCFLRKNNTKPSVSLALLVVAHFNILSHQCRNQIMPSCLLPGVRDGHVGGGPERVEARDERGVPRGGDGAVRGEAQGPIV